MLNLTSKIAVKAVIYLASKYESGNNSSINEVAEYINASEHTVGKILQTLAKLNVINSLKGPSGGFYISKTQLKQPIIIIVEAIEGKKLFKECGLGLKKCSSSRPCPIHNEYTMVRDLVHKLFSYKTISDLCEPVNKGLAYLIG